jgi:hypothetical protein
MRSLDRGDVDDHTSALFQHQRQQPPIETHSRQQVAVRRVLPLVVREGGEAATQGRRSADSVDQHVNA